MRITKMWHRDTKWANAVEKMALIDLVDIGCHKTSIYRRTQYLWSTTKQSVIKWGMLV